MSLRAQALIYAALVGLGFALLAYLRVSGGS